MVSQLACYFLSFYLLGCIYVTLAAIDPRNQVQNAYDIIDRDIYISVTGDDTSGDGSFAKPWRTLQRFNPDRYRHVTLHFGPGIHSLVEMNGITLGPNDNNTTIVGAGSDKTFLSGATLIKGWTASVDKKSSLPIWTATLSPNITYFRQLFVMEGNEFTRRFTSRSNEMHYSHTNMKDPKFSIVYSKGQVLNEYHNQDDVLVTIYHCWTATTHRIRSINPANFTLTLFQAPHVDIKRCEHASGKRFYIEDAQEYLSTPGQFYYDRVSRNITYIPLDGEDITSFHAYAPQLVTLLSLKNTKNIHISNLSLVHAAIDMNGFFFGDCDAQSASNLKTAAVALNYAQSCYFDHINIQHTGGFGIWINKSCVDINLQRSKIFDIGAGAVRIGSYSKTAPEDITRDVSLTDSELHGGGRVYIMGPGILLEACTNCTVSHNLIHDFFYTGISTGYGFSECPSCITHVVLSYNELYSLGQGRLSDMGCFYTWGGIQPHLVIDHNVCHDVHSYGGGYGAWGLYNDQTSQDVLWTNNIVFNTSGACYHDHQGTNITIKNNIFVHMASGEGALKSTSPDPSKGWESSFLLNRNIIYAGSDTQIFTDTLSVAPYALSTFDWNLYWLVGKETKFPGNQNLKHWQEHGAGPLGGEDRHSIVGDPLFADIKTNNFTLLPNSPALKLGFEPIDISDVGPRE